MQRTAAVSTGPYTHLDHLGVLAAFLSIPLIVTDERSAALAKTFYPQTEVIFKEPAELTLDFLRENFDLLLGCGKYWCLELQPLFQLLYRKKMRFILCPHGNSDKGSTTLSHPQQDIAFVYGEQMEKLMRENGMMEKVTAVVRTGNYRYPFYLNHQSFYDRLAEEKILHRFSKEKKTILYAPTWSSQMNQLQFFHNCESLIQALSSQYNLLIKPHPFTEEDLVGELSLLHAKYRDNPNVAFGDGFPAIYSLLARCDAYVGDYSSIGYDFLAFDRPLYFFQTSYENPPLIAQAGVELGENPQEIFQESRETFSKARRKIYQRAFGAERTAPEIKQELELLLQ